MALTSSRRVRGLALAACAAVALPVVAATPAAAQTAGTTTTSTALSGATSASAVRLTINLPSALPINPIQLDIDPVAGTVRAVPGSAPEAQAIATLLSGSVGGTAQSFPGAMAQLPEPTSSSAPTNAVSDGINGSPLGTGDNAFLNVGLLTATAEVTEAPTSTSRAQIADLELGLPAALAEALAQVLTPLLEGIDTALEALAPLDDATAALCDGLTPVTVPLGDGVEAVPVLGPVLNDVIEGTLTDEQAVVCNLRAFLTTLVDELEAGLTDITGPGGLLNADVIESSQSITREGAKVTATATSRIAGLTIIGHEPFGDAEALRTASTAVVDGATSDATVERTAVEAYAQPLLGLETDLDAITGNLTTIDLTGLTGVLDQLQTLLDALAGIGLEAGPLDAADATLASCPTALSNSLSGTFEAPGCAAAAARGFGLAVTLPAALAGPLGIETDEDGEPLPLISLQIVPSAAVARAETTTTTTPPTEFRGPLPRTGAEYALAGTGVALLLGAALVRRRRTAAL